MDDGSAPARVPSRHFIELGSRRVLLAAHPSSEWVTQQARQLTWTWPAREEPIRFLIRDRNQKFAGGFDEVFRSEDIEVMRTPFRASQANGEAERSCGPSVRNASTGS